ncbi:MAG TPA: ABC transporter substrate-binding protein [Methanocella sp.]|uniref:ABC transporter substrate-binding protein n=1 Tax=Methanocella sp. TaxID=2052833 RepID=UPI002CA65236|nr:ABC transporter substrate-binding protein [Methanocella sp.]HTY90926.1 ABC transporter substrate-binding protein [Methanocella sp.]
MLHESNTIWIVMSTSKPLNIGHLSTVYHTSFILEGTGWLQKAGIDARWKLFASGPDIVKAFENKEIDIGYIGLPPVIIGVARGIPFKCIAGGHVEGTVMLAQKQYKSLDELGDISKVLKQFEGSIMGTPPKGSIHDVIARDLAESLGLNIEIKNYAWADFVLDALVEGEIPAAAGTPPLAVAARRFCGARIVVPPHELWPNNPSYGIVARTELFESPGIIMRFLEMHETACNFIREKPEEAAEIVAKLTEIVDPEFVLEAYRISPKYCSALSPEYVSSTMRFVDVLLRMDYISRPVSEEEIFDFRFIRKAHPGPAHYNL